MVPMLIPITYAYLLAQRRAAMVALIIGLVLLAAMVFLRSRQLFWKYVPALASRRYCSSERPGTAAGHNRSCLDSGEDDVLSRLVTGR